MFRGLCDDLLCLISDYLDLADFCKYRSMIGISSFRYVVYMTKILEDEYERITRVINGVNTEIASTIETNH